MVMTVDRYHQAPFPPRLPPSLEGDHTGDRLVRSLYYNNKLILPTPSITARRQTTRMVVLQESALHIMLEATINNVSLVSNSRQSLTVRRRSLTQPTSMLSLMYYVSRF